MDRVEKRTAWVKDGGRRLSNAYFVLPRRLDQALRVYCEYKGITQRKWLTKMLLENIDDKAWLEMTAIVEDCEKMEASND